MLSELNTLHLMPGDILLTRDNSLGGRLNAAYQRRQRRAHLTDHLRTLDYIPTHAALLLNADQVIHSTNVASHTDKEYRLSIRDPFKLLLSARKLGLSNALRRAENQGVLRAARSIIGHGVDIDAISDFFKHKHPPDVLLIRHPGVATAESWNSDIGVLIQHSAMYHLDKPYNPLVGLSDGDDAAAFCSQLVYQILSTTGIDLPTYPPEHVLPLDFLIWAAERGWPIMRGYQIWSVLSRQTKYRVRWPNAHTNILEKSVQIHRAIVQRLQGYKRLSEALDQFNELTADLIKSGISAHLPPCAWREQGLESLGHPQQSITGIIQAADKIYSYLTGYGHLPGAKPQEESVLDSRLSPVLHELAGKPLSWSLVRSKAREEQRSEIPPDVVIAGHYLDWSEVILNDFDRAVTEAVEHLEQIGNETPGTKPIRQDSGETLLDEPLEVLVFIGRFFDCSEDNEDLEKQKTEVDIRLKSLGDQFTADSQKLIGTLRERNQGDVGVYVADEGEIVKLSRHVRVSALALYQYSRAWDFACVCHWLKSMDEGSSFDRNVKMLAVHNPGQLLEICRTLRDHMPKMRSKIGEAVDKLLDRA